MDVPNGCMIMDTELFRYLGQGVYTRQRDFSAGERVTTKAKTLTEVVIFDRLVLPTEKSIFDCLQIMGASAGNSSDLDDISSRLARREEKLYADLKRFVPALPQGRVHTHFVRGQTGYLPGEVEFARIDSTNVAALRDPATVTMSMRHPQNIALGYGISGRIEIGVNDHWEILDYDRLGALMGDNVRKSNTLNVFGTVDEKLLSDLYEVVDIDFAGSLYWLPDSSKEICKNLAGRTMGAYIQQQRQRSLQQQQAETTFCAAIGALSQLVADKGIPRNHFGDKEIVN